MRLDILKALNTERAARRAAVVVTNQDSGAQRLVTQDKIAADPLKDVLDAHLRSGKSGVEETAEGKVFLTVYVPPTRLIAIGAVPTVGDMDLLTDRIGALEGVERTTSSIVLSTKFER